MARERRRPAGAGSGGQWPPAGLRRRPVLQWRPGKW
jgi:hypothetical protein